MRHHPPLFRLCSVGLAALACVCGAAAADSTAPTSTALHTSAGDFHDDHIIADAAMASSDQDAMSRVLDSSAEHGDATVDGGGEEAPGTLVPVVPGQEPVIVGGSQNGMLSQPDDGHGTTAAGFGTSQRGFGSNSQGFGGTPSQPGSGDYTDPSVDYGHHLEPVPGVNAPPPSAQRP